MPLVSLIVEQYVQWRFGVTAALGLALLGLGLKPGNENAPWAATCTAVGGFLLVAPALTAGA
ncbi:hypothetical protein [Streptomyces peucetius]|uniref:Uncharacterized protein n=1 Tax=Streptomyces peucetius TaxID=1950 RepID=A0ABY6I7K9_STRPE|nr:hypothetical protein [Streptomyces peucetius]UYQ62983.1 hypothetical protein OGH68_16815 [Streptomyces peucetius]